MSMKRLWPTPVGSDNSNRQSGPTPSNLKGEHGWGLKAAIAAEDTFQSQLDKESPQSTFLLEGSLVSPSLLPGSEAARQTTATSGLRCCASLRSSSPVGCLLRTLLESHLWSSSTVYLRWTGNNILRTRRQWDKRVWVQCATERGEEYWIRSWATLKKSDTKSERLLFRLVPSTPRTEGTGCGLWPTIRASDADHGGPNGRDSAGNPHLPMAVKMWPTPTTPRPHDNESTAGKYMPSQNQKDLAAVVAPTGGQLNPTWVEWLMGYPEGWTALDV